jgi:hypothetical protein
MHKMLFKYAYNFIHTSSGLVARAHDCIKNGGMKLPPPLRERSDESSSLPSVLTSDSIKDRTLASIAINKCYYWLE